jgi:hypothetical protein
VPCWGGWLGFAFAVGSYCSGAFAVTATAALVDLGMM